MENTKESSFATGGRQDCSDMHSFGPGLRTIYIIHYVIRGCGYFVCGGKKHRITRGQSFVIRPFTEIHYYPDKEDPWEYTWIEFTGKEFLHWLEITAFCDDDCVIDFIEPKLILPLFDCLNSLREPTSMIQFSDAPQKIALAILSVYSELHPLLGRKTRDGFYFDSACTIIKSSYQKPELGIEALCRELNISRATLHRCFINSCGISPGAYLVNYRIERAKELLSHGITAKATALSCGFTDPLYFSKVFRKAYGISPREFSKH